MPAPCEIAVKSVIPAIRAYIAKELIQTYRMKQTDVALLLGITQTAVSKYASNVRGQAVRIGSSTEIQGMMNQMASKMAHKTINGSQLTLELCGICKAARRTGLMCELCQRSDPLPRKSICRICMKKMST